MKKVLLIKPKTKLESSIISKAESLLPPLGLLYIASALQKAKHTVSFIDKDLDKKSLQQTILEFKPDWIGITSTTPSFPNAIKIAKVLKKLTKAPIVLGGVHASSLGGKLLEKYEYIDYLVKGEGEEAMVHLVNGKPPKNIEGVCYKEKEKTIEKELTFIKDLNTLEFPNRKITKKYEYQDSPLYRRTEKHATILFSRGCVHQCVFCDYQTRGKPRFRNSQDILKELKKAYNQEYNDFRVLDEFFTMNKPLVKKVCTGIIRSGMKITWNCQTRADAVDEETIRLMKLAGCWGVQIGVETGSQKVMKKINKKLDLKKVPKTVKVLKKHKMFTVCFFMVGFPFETKKDIEKTIQFTQKLDCDLITYSRVTPFPATDLWLLSGLDEYNEETIKKLGIFSNEQYFLKNIDLSKYSKKAFKGFYWRPKIVYRLLKEALLHGSMKRRINYVQALIQGTAL